MACLGAVQLRLDVVVADLQAERGAHRHAGDTALVGEPDVGARLRARVVLLDLRAVLDPVGLEGRGDAVVREELQVRVQRVGDRLRGPSASSSWRRYCVQAITRWPRRPAWGRPSPSGSGSASPSSAAGVGVPSPSPHTARAGRTPDMLHEPLYAIAMNDEIAALVEHARDLRVAVEAVVVLGVDEGAVLVEGLGGHGHPPLVAEVGRLDDDEALVAGRRRELELGDALGGVVGHAEVDVEPAVPKSPTSAA